MDAPRESPDADLAVQLRRIRLVACLAAAVWVIGTAILTVSAQSVRGNRSLESTEWKVIELAGKPTPPQDPERRAQLLFQAGRFSGSDGCNRITGTYHVNGDRITLAHGAVTGMACVNAAAEIERAFQNALKKTARFTIVGDRLELLDRRGGRVAALTASVQPTSSLEGTSWQLVKFQGGDDTILKPDDGSKYTIAFGAGGQLTVRVDCNRGIGTWKSAEPNQIELGPLALTRAQCPAGSLHDQIVRQWEHITSYVTRDGHLFLSLKLDGGIYEFEPIK